MGVGIVDIAEFESLLDAKINPLIETIKRLEQSQEKIVEVMMAQVKMNESLSHLQKTLDDHLSGSTLIHNELFKRMRESETSGKCSDISKELTERINDIEDKYDDKVWDVAKLLVAGAIGGFVSWAIKR